MLVDFMGCTATDLYIWIIEHQKYLREAFWGEISIEVAAERFTDDVDKKKFKKKKK
jgi:hypothetical protein